jgi:hypothetical protein
MREWIKNFFSLDERRVSTLTIAFFAFCGVGVWLLITTKNIPMPLTYIIISISGLIAGVNTIPSMFGQMSNGYYGDNNNYGFNNYSSTNNYGNYNSETIARENNPNTSNPV